MSVESLRKMVQAASALHEDPCEIEGHLWLVAGYRPCPCGGDGSQPVYQCARPGCEVWDYGEEGGPAWQECQSRDCECGGWLV